MIVIVIIALLAVIMRPNLFKKLEIPVILFKVSNHFTESFIARDAFKLISFSYVKTYSGEELLNSC